jgi:hypothetical protein
LIAQRKLGGQLDHLPSNMQVLTYFGERADISADNRRGNRAGPKCRRMAATMIMPNRQQPKSIGRDVTVIPSTHIVDDVHELCSRMATLANREVLLEGTPAASAS